MRCKFMEQKCGHDIIRIALFCLALILLVTPAMAATTQVQIIKYANDNTTILSEQTLTYQQMRDTLPILGDGITHYYQQGPVFVDNADEAVEQALRWNPAEDTNVQEKDVGAVKGTNLKDLCDLVGGMSPGERVKIISSDGFYKWFAYKNVYDYSSREGPIGLSWYTDFDFNPATAGMYPDTGYSDGMRLIWFADNSTNPWHINAFGNYDWHEAADSVYWYYNTGDAGELYPTTTGLSAKYVNRIYIYSDDAPPAPVAPVAAFSATPLSGNTPLAVQFTDQSTGTGPLTYAWDFNNDGITDNSTQSPSYVYAIAGTYTVNLTVTNGVGSDSEVKTGYISVSLVPVVDEWTITLNGQVNEQLSRVNFESLAAGNRVTIIDASGTWSGIALWRILARVDDTNPTTFSDTTADLGYNVTVAASDGFSRVFNSSFLKRNDNVIVADTLNGVPLPKLDGTKKIWPLKVVGSVPTNGHKVGNITQITLSDFVAPPITPVAAFEAAPLSGTAPLSVQFTDQSTGTGPLTYSWDFNNDGITDNSTQSPSYVYAIAGTYTVNLTVTNGVGSDSEVKTGYISVSSVPVVDTLYDGTVTLTTGETFTKNAYNNVTNVYTINRTTPLGALDKIATLQGFTYNVTDSRWQYDKVLLLDDIGKYIRKNPNYWYAYVNGVYKDGYLNTPNGLNVIELNTNDQVNFYYAPNKDPNPVVNATAVVKIKVNIQAPGPVVDTIYDGTVTLTTGETFTKNAYNNVTNVYTINRTTPLGALDKVATLQAFTYNVTDSRWQYDKVLLLDDIGKYIRKTPNYWYAYVNGVYKDGYLNTPNGLNVIELNTNDQVNFYYAPNKDPNPVVNATAVVKIKVNIGDQPTVPDWTLSLSGAKTTSVTKTFFEEGLACPSSGHQVFWTDTDGNVWGGVPLWVLVSMVDDSPDVGPDHFNFNDSIAAQGYSVKVSSGDGWDTTLSSQNIARNNSIIVANTLNGQPLPRNLTNGKLSWPLHLKGAAVFGGQQVGNITSIQLTGLPQPPTEWKLTLEGDVTDTITQSYFVDAIACKHNVTWTDASTGTVWQGVPLWDLAGAVDDIETSSHFTFNDTRATMGYTIRVSAADGYNATFASATAAHNDGFFVAYKKNGTALTGSDAPLKLVGPATTSGKQRVGGIVKISFEGLPDQYPAGDWQLKLNGKISDVIPQGEFEYWALHHNATYTDINNNVYTGVPLWRLIGWVDDRIPHGSNGFDDAAAIAGYKVIVKAGDGYAKDFTSQQIGKTDAFIIANTMNGAPLPTDGSHPPYPLRLVGSGATGGSSVGNVVEIQLTDFQTPTEAPKLHIIKYGTDGVTIINETYVDYTYMESNLPVIGDGTTAYKFEGLTMNPSNLWDPEETYPGGFKISNVVKGSRVHDLAELVGGMGSGTTITFIASDGFETTLPYSSIYTNPAVQARQGDAIIAWWGDGQYVPQYADGMRLFFTPDGDHVYGQWDMHETLPSQYWRYNFQDNVQYPSAAGLSAKYITTIKVYSSPESDWTLELDGRDIGGVHYNVSKPYLEEAIACQFGADHKATYTDSKGRVWEGMPLWFFVGFVDDADQHSANAYNMTKALAGYNIVITGNDSYTTTISGKDIIRSSNYLIANSLNGTHISDSDESWPLKLTGANVTGGMTVKGVKKIELKSISAPAEQTLYFTPQSVAVIPGQSATYTIKMSSLPQGLAGFNISVSLTNPSIGEITNITLPSWVVLKRTSALPADVLWIEGVDLNKAINAGATDVTIGQITIRGDQTGVTPLTLGVKMMTADGGANIVPTLIDGELRVHIPLDANFTADVKSGPAPLTVAFTDLTTGTPDPTNYLWDFGDGNTSTSKNPLHIYTSYGRYNVSLTVSNPYSQGKEEKIGYINVARYVEPFPTLTKMPTDPDNDGLYEDINGNGVIDYDDVVEFFWNMDWVIGNKQVGILPYDFNGNGYIEYDDVVLLFGEVE
jgi:PKD repeat protein/DMSO/TMAO reductase YedYZ molybdopterin-dependent catalytic subunit